MYSIYRDSQPCASRLLLWRALVNLRVITIAVVAGILLTGCPNLLGSGGGGSNGPVAEEGGIPSYFWGRWVRMDGTNASWYINDETVQIDGDESEIIITGPTSLRIAGEEVRQITANMVSVTRESGLPFYLFRVSGANAQVSAGVRGDTITASSSFSGAISVSGVPGIAGINTVLRNVNNPRNALAAITGNDGSLAFNEVIPGDEYILEVPEQSGVTRRVEVPVVPAFDGENIGFVTITEANQNFNVSSSVSGGDSWGNLYAGQPYDLTITITNIGTEDMESANYQVFPPDGLSLTGEGLQNILGTVQADGGSRELSFTVQADTFTTDTRDFEVPVRITSVDGRRVWEDQISLRFNRETMTIHVRSDQHPTRGNEIQGVLITPERRSIAFQTSGRRADLTVPARVHGYVLALSGANYDSETRYAFRINEEPTTDGGELSSTQIHEPNNNETEATDAYLYTDYLGWLGVGDLDFFAIHNSVSDGQVIQWQEVFPFHGYITADSTPILSWDEIAGALQYDLQIAATAEGITSAPITPVTTNTYTIPSPLVEEETIYWRVRKVSFGGGASSWTPASALTYREFSVGETGPAGGIVVYDKGDRTDGWRYLEAAPTDAFDSNSDWINYAWRDFRRGTSPDIGAGHENTATIVQAIGQDCTQIWDRTTNRFQTWCPETRDPAKYGAWSAHFYNAGGYADWHLPSTGELQQVYQYRGFLDSHFPGYYWSSTENIDHASYAQIVSFSNGSETFAIKYRDGQSRPDVRVRPVRYF